MTLDLMSLNFLPKDFSQVLVYSGYSLLKMIIGMIISYACAIAFVVAGRNKKAENPKCMYPRSRIDAL